MPPRLYTGDVERGQMIKVEAISRRSMVEEKAVGVGTPRRRNRRDFDAVYYMGIHSHCGGNPLSPGNSSTAWDLCQRSGRGQLIYGTKAKTEAERP